MELVKMVKKQNWFLFGFLSCGYAGFSHYGELNLKALVGRRIRELRNRRGITQAVLAEKAGLSIEFIGRVERGKHIPSLFRICRICMALNCTLGDFFNHADFT
jgi:Predicted transcriptional regulators